MSEQDRAPAKRQEPEDGVPVVPIESRKRHEFAPAPLDDALPILGLEEVIQNLDEHSSPKAWRTVMRIQWVRDRRGRGLDWWFRRFWNPNGCPLSLAEVQATARREHWEEQRFSMWERVASHILDQFVDLQAEEALTATRKWRAVEAIMLDQLTPKVVIDPETGQKRLELKHPVKSYEGLARSLVEVKKAMNEATDHAMQIMAGAANPKAGLPSDEADENEAAGSPRRMVTDTIRDVANELALGSKLGE